MSYYAKANSRGRRAYNGYMATAHTAQKALALATQVASLINVEFKYLDTQAASTPSSTPSITHLTNISAGTGVSQREGQQVKLKSFRHRIYVTQHPSATLTTLRNILFIDTQCDGTTPASQELLEDNTNIISFKKQENNSRFIILYDKIITLGDKKMHLSEYYKEFDTKINWSGTAGGDVLGNHVYMLSISSEATNTPTIYSYTRATYLDN